MTDSSNLDNIKYWCKKYFRKRSSFLINFSFLFFNRPITRCYLKFPEFVTWKLIPNCDGKERYAFTLWTNARNFRVNAAIFVCIGIISFEVTYLTLKVFYNQHLKRMMFSLCFALKYYWMYTKTFRKMQQKVDITWNMYGE